MKFVALSALSFILYASTAVVYALQSNWVLTAVWSAGALIWVPVTVQFLKAHKRAREDHKAS